MALTVDILNANTALAALPDDIKTAITTLSTNDEATVINTKMGEMFGEYDGHIKTLGGIDKNNGEKTSDYMKRVLSDYKTKAEGATTLQTQITDAQKTITDLKKQITDGNTDVALKQQLTDAQSELTTLKGQLTTEKENWTKEKETLLTEMSLKDVNVEYNGAISKLKFKTAYPSSVQGSLLKAARTEVLAEYKPDWVETNGTKTMVFRDAKGEIVRNSKNLNNPFTFEELLRDKLTDALEVERKIKGTETNDPKGGPDTIELVDISSAKNQVQADELIIKYLIQNGFLKGTSAFSDKQKEIRKEQKVSALPMR